MQESNQQDIVIKEGCLEILNMLASGGQSQVYRGKLDGESVAIKVFQEEEYFVNERALLKKQYPNVIRLVGDTRVGGFHALVFELLD